MNKRGKSGDYHLNLNLDSFLFTWKDTSHGRPNMYHQKSNGREKRAWATPTPKRAPIHVAKRNGAPLIGSSVLLAVLEKTIGRNPFLSCILLWYRPPIDFLAISWESDVMTADSLPPTAWIMKTHPFFSLLLFGPKGKKRENFSRNKYFHYTTNGS